MTRGSAASRTLFTDSSTNGTLFVSVSYKLMPNYVPLKETFFKKDVS